MKSRKIERHPDGSFTIFSGHIPFELDGGEGWHSILMKRGWWPFRRSEIWWYKHFKVPEN